MFLIKDENHNDIFEIHGHYTYRSPEGKFIEVWYKADENGFQIVEPALRTRIGSDALGSLIGGGVG